MCKPLVPPRMCDKSDVRRCALLDPVRCLLGKDCLDARIERCLYLGSERIIRGWIGSAEEGYPFLPAYTRMQLFLLVFLRRNGPSSQLRARRPAVCFVVGRYRGLHSRPACIQAPRSASVTAICYLLSTIHRSFCCLQSIRPLALLLWRSLTHPHPRSSRYYSLRSRRSS